MQARYLSTIYEYFNFELNSQKEKRKQKVDGVLWCTFVQYCSFLIPMRLRHKWKLIG